jgi:hypothetical protein
VPFPISNIDGFCENFALATSSFQVPVKGSAASAGNALNSNTTHKSLIPLSFPGREFEFAPDLVDYTISFDRCGAAERQPKRR